MRIPLEPGDRRLLIISGSLLVLLTGAATLLSPPPETPTLGYPTSFSTASRGAKAAYLLLGELGYSVERWTSPPRELPAQPTKVTLLLAEPTIPASTEERARLGEFVRRGGRLLATGAAGARVLPQNDARPLRKRLEQPRNFRARLPGPLSRQAPEILMEPAVRWDKKRPHHLPYYGDKEGATVVWYRLGKGEVIWWADSIPLENHGLAQASNLMLFLNSVGSPDRTRVLWDEYFHGLRPGFWSYISGTPTPWAALQLGLLAVAALFTFGRRHGPVRPLATPGARLSPLEFVDTVGELYERKRAAAGALQIAYHRFRFLLLRRLGLPDAATPEQIGRGVREHLGWMVPGLEETLRGSEKALKAPRLLEAEALRLVQALHDYTRRFRLTG